MENSYISEAEATEYFINRHPTRKLTPEELFKACIFSLFWNLWDKTKQARIGDKKPVAPEI